MVASDSLTSIRTPVVGIRQRHPGRCPVEGQAEPLLCEIEVVGFADSASDVAQRHHDTLRIAHRNVHVGLEQDLPTVGVVEREHRARDVVSAAKVLPVQRQQRTVGGAYRAT